MINPTFNLRDMIPCIVAWTNGRMYAFNFTNLNDPTKVSQYMFESFYRIDITTETTGPTPILSLIGPILLIVLKKL